MDNRIRIVSFELPSIVIIANRKPKPTPQPQPQQVKQNGSSRKQA